MHELNLLPFPETDVADDEVVLRPTEHAALADLGAVLQLCAAGRPSRVRGTWVTWCWLTHWSPRGDP